MEKEALSVREAAEYLGIKETSLRMLMSKHKISFYRTARKRVYFDIKDLRAYVFGTRVCSNAELKAKAEAASLNG